MSNWLPSLNALRAFEVTARKKSYRKAAEELGVTTAAVKQLVEKLENLLGEKLFLGRGQNLKITSVGEIGLEELNISFKQIERTVNRMKSYKNKNRLVITCEPSFASAWLVPRLNKFKTLNPSMILCAITGILNNNFVCNNWNPEQLCVESLESLTTLCVIPVSCCNL